MYKKTSVLMVLMLALCSVFFSSCKPNPCDDTPVVKPSVYLDIDYSPMVVLGQNLTIEKLTLNERSSKGIRIKEVRYYLDDMLLGATATAPFTLKHRVENVAVGEHKLVVKAIVEGEEYITEEYTSNFKVVVLEEALDVSYNLAVDEKNCLEIDEKNWRFVTSRNLPWKGEVKDLTKNFDCEVNGVKFYWDWELVGSDDSAPYTFEYSLDKEAVGSHSFKVEVQTKSKYGNISFTHIYTVDIKE